MSGPGSDRAPSVPWSTAEDALLLAAIQLRLTYAELAVAMSKQGYDRSVRAITYRASYLGLPRKARGVAGAKPPLPPAPQPEPKPLPPDLEIRGARDARGVVWPPLSGWCTTERRIPLDRRYGRGPE